MEFFLSYRKMTKTLSLFSLFSLLLFLHVHGSSAREMKIEEENPKQDQNDQTKTGKPYITAYGADIKANQAYLIGNLPPYHNHKKQESSESYLTGYQNHKKEKSESYITAYGTSKRENRPYITAYGTGKKDSPRENPKESFAASNNKVDHTEVFKTGYFALDDLYIGNKMTLQFPIKDFPNFLTKKEADTIPFSTSQLPSVLQLLSIPQHSSMAQEMKDTLNQCELQSLTAETKVCVSSLESMTDFIRSIFGSDSQLDIITTNLPASSRGVPLQSMTVLEISPDFCAPKWVGCHPLPYPYAVYYCHFVDSGTKIFKVKLGSENGEQVEALGVCHLDTSEWDPNHILFKRLGFKAGEAPVCHFLPVKHLIWIPCTSETTM